VHCEGDRILGLTLHHETMVICLIVTSLMLLLAAFAAFVAANVDDVIAPVVMTFLTTLPSDERQLLRRPAARMRTCLAIMHKDSDRQGSQHICEFFSDRLCHYFVNCACFHAQFFGCLA